ncbi:sensor histidine kinase [Spirosoma fluviale]|uniref:sensor histidine kinase n=1 Tax=Spirosoma fluviale TaxID=1597977 RepID=UPI0015C807AC|nr:ATP-binding protein [Spirosoma fluviale]
MQNALKFTHAGGSVLVNFQEDNGFGQLIIRDTGIGMEPQLVADLFRLDKQTSRLGTGREQGTGPGLVLVNELVDVNQGALQAVSEAGKGTTFTLTFVAVAITL